MVFHWKNLAQAKSNSVQPSYITNISYVVLQLEISPLGWLWLAQARTRLSESLTSLNKYVFSVYGTKYDCRVSLELYKNKKNKEEEEEESHLHNKYLGNLESFSR